MEKERDLSFHEIMQLLTMADEGLASFTDSELTEMLKKAEVKVDGYKYFIEKLEAESERLQKRLKEYQEAKKAVDSKIDATKKFLVFHMQQNGFEKFRGGEFSVALRTFKSVEPRRDPTEADDFTRRKIEWDKVALAKALKEEDAKAMEVAELRDKVSPIFSLIKEAK